MRLKFIGAAGGSVTGSCTHFYYQRTKTSFLVDCGLVQGEGDFEASNNAPFPFDAGEIKFVLLTHAHVDHCGQLPRLVRSGFSGEVICTAATAKLARMSLLDSANYPGSLFTRDEVDRIRFSPIEDSPSRAQAGLFPVGKDLFASFRRTAHIVGSCSVTIGWLDEQDVRRYLVMSGDLGNNVRTNLYQPLLAHRRGVYAYPDAIVVESTYGDRSRSSAYKSFDNRIEALRRLLQTEVFDRKAFLIIPAFALQRTHELLFDLVVVLQRYFATEAESTSPYLVPSRFWSDFEGACWNGRVQKAVDRALHAVSVEERARWIDAIEPSGEDAHPYRLKVQCGKTIDELRALVEGHRTTYPVDITLDSSLARSMGAVIRQELQRRATHKPEEFAHRNPELQARLGLATEEALTKMLVSLLPESDTETLPLTIGPHSIQFRQAAVPPSRAACETRGAILITGGGMCDGGPVVEHLQEVATQKRECVLVQTGFMPRYSLGARLTTIARANALGETTPNATIDIGSKAGVPIEDIRLRTVDISPFYSGHADQDGLVDFVCAADGRVPNDGVPPIARVFINHGSPAARQALKQAIVARGVERRSGDRVIGEVELPETAQQAFDLISGQWVDEEEGGTFKQLLAALLKEQVKTNELLRQLLQTSGSTTQRSYIPSPKSKHKR